jgi:DNA repair exonuclease SbcCD nuclease subunit
MILNGERLPPLPCRGLLIIGDPHVGSRRPGRRKDPDWPAPVLAKLEHCAAIARERGLATVILGDLFDRANERDLALKSQLVRILKSFPHRPLVNVGNHDIEHTTLSDSDSLALLGLCDIVDVAPRSGPALELLLPERRIGIGLTPFGQPIPEDVSGSFAEADELAWFTHHDIAFEGAYPGAVPPFAIRGCGMVVNGHMHATKPPVRAGATLWTNPGNIARQSVDLVDHLPRAWTLGADGDLLPHVLPHQSDVFDLTGRVVAAASEDRVAGAVESAFVSLLQAETPGGLKRSDDGSIIREEIEARFEARNTPEVVRAIVRSLLTEAVERRAGA